MKYLRQSTAATVVVGPFLAVADGFTPKTALGDQSAKCAIEQNGTDLGAITLSSWAHNALGHYGAGLSTTHTNTLGRLRIVFSDPATYLPVWEDFSVLSQAVYDALFGATAISTYAGGAVASVTGAVGSVTGAVGSVTGNVGGNVVGSVGSVASFGTLVADVAAAVWAAGTRSLTSFGTLVASIWAAVADSPGVTTLLARITGLLPLASDYSAARATKLDNLDVASSTLATATNMTEANADLDELITTVGAAGAGLTAIPGVDLTEVNGDLDEIIATLGAAGAGLTAIPAADTSGVTTLLIRIPGVVQPQTGDSFARLGAPVLADISHDIAARLAAASYVAPANPTDYARNNAAPSWWTAPDNADVVAALADLVVLLARTDPTSALATLQAAVTAVKAVTDRQSGMITGSPGVFTAPALALAPGGSSTVIYGMSGAIKYTFQSTQLDGVTPLPGVAVYVSADSGGALHSQVQISDSLGNTVWWLNAATVYFFQRKEGYIYANNPLARVVS